MIRKKYSTLATMLAATAGLMHFSCEGQDTDLCCPPPMCCEESSGHFFVEGDLLYWKAHVSGLELGFGTSTIDQTTVSQTQTTISNEYDADPHFKWNAGYRIAAGYQFDCSEWELGAVWTYFHDHGSKSINEDADTVNTTRCGVKLDQLDILFAYNTSLNSCFKFKPFVGIRAARIKENLNALLVTDITISPSTFATRTVTLDDDQTYRGIGPILGIQGIWDVGCGFGIYGNAAASLMYGKYNVHFNDTDIFSAPLSDQIFSRNVRHLRGVDCNIDLALGITWNTCVCDSYQLSLKLGFEHHQFFNHNRLGVARGDLIFDGGVFSVGLAL